MHTELKWNAGDQILMELKTHTHTHTLYGDRMAIITEEMFTPNFWGHRCVQWNWSSTRVQLVAGPTLHLTARSAKETRNTYTAVHFVILLVQELKCFAGKNGKKNPTKFKSGTNCEGIGKFGRIFVYLRKIESFFFF